MQSTQPIRFSTNQPISHTNQDPFLQGLQFLKANQTDKALSSFNQALKEKPDHVEAYLKRAQAHLRKKQYNFAVSDCTEVIKKQPSAQVYRFRSEAFRQIEIYNLAMQDSNKVVDMEPYNHQSYICRGLINEALEKYQLAYQDYSRAVGCKSQQAEGYMYRGIVSEKMGNFGRAISDFTEAIKRNPKRSNYYITRGVAYQICRDHGLAIQDFNEAIKLFPKGGSAYLSKGISLKMLGRYKEAQQCFLQADTRWPGNPLYLFNLSQNYSLMGNKQQASLYFDKAIGIFQKEDQETVKNKFRLKTKSMNYIHDVIKQYRNQQNMINKLRVQAKILNQKNIVQELNHLEYQSKQTLINSVQHLDIKSTNSGPNQEIQMILKKMQQIELELKRTKEMQYIQEGRTNQLQRRMTEGQQQVKLLKEQVDQINKQYDKMKDKIYAVERVLDKIEQIDSKKLNQYYKLLYHTFVAHFMAYRIQSTGFFATQNRNFNSVDTVLSTLTKFQSAFSKIPSLGSIVGLPFTIINYYSTYKTASISTNIEKKISCSHFASEAIITETLAYVVSLLLQNKNYNTKILSLISDSQESYISKLSAIISNGKNTLFSKVFGNSYDSFSYIQQVVIFQITLFTVKISEIQPEEFTEMTKQNDIFYRRTLEWLHPEGQKIQNSQKKRDRGDIGSMNEIDIIDDTRSNNQRSSFVFIRDPKYPEGGYHVVMKTDPKTGRTVEARQQIIGQQNEQQNNCMCVIM